MVLDQQEQSEKLIEEFGRQILVPGINEEGQINISKKKICIIGLGALGTVASQYLVRAGVGEIHLIDYDIIENKIEADIDSQEFINHIGDILVVLIDEKLKEDKLNAKN